MRTLLYAGLAAAALSLTALTPAQAQGGCGPWGHRGWDGFCHRNHFGPPRPLYGYGYGYGYHRPWGYHRGWGGYHGGWGYHHPVGFYRHW